MASRIAAVREKLHEKKTNAANAFTSWDNFKQWVMVPDTALDLHSKSSITWSNVDLDPTPPERRNWKGWNYFVFYWVSTIEESPILDEQKLIFISSDDWLWQLDIRLNNDRYRLELVAKHFDHFHQPAYQLARSTSTRRWLRMRN
jgi:hypothetical protein